MDGGFLVFATYAQLTSDDIDTAKDIYRYDSATGELQRVSLGEEGNDANGNNDEFNVSLVPNSVLAGLVRSQDEASSRAMSEDGSRIVFVTSEPLSSQAINHLPNVYEWDEGAVSLISGGTASSPVFDVVISPSGDDVFFVTTQGLAPQDTDGASDVYDLHSCTPSAPCFPAQPEKEGQCGAEGCQGPLTNPAPMLVPGSVSQAPGDNVPTPAKAVQKAKSKPKKKAKKKKRGHVRHRKARHSTKALKSRLGGGR
jgi:hypothetical protein